eukprot:tig00000498_g1668.t1
MAQLNIFNELDEDVIKRQIFARLGLVQVAASRLWQVSRLFRDVLRGAEWDEVCVPIGDNDRDRGRIAALCRALNGGALGGALAVRVAYGGTPAGLQLTMGTANVDLLAALCRRPQLERLAIVPAEHANELEAGPPGARGPPRDADAPGFVQTVVRLAAAGQRRVLKRGLEPRPLHFEVDIPEPAIDECTPRLLASLVLASLRLPRGPLPAPAALALSRGLPYLSALSAAPESPAALAALALRELHELRVLPCPGLAQERPQLAPALERLAAACPALCLLSIGAAVEGASRFGSGLELGGPAIRALARLPALEELEIAVLPEECEGEELAGLLPALPALRALSLALCLEQPSGPAALAALARALPAAPAPLRDVRLSVEGPARCGPSLAQLARAAGPRLRALRAALQSPCAAALAPALRPCARLERLTISLSLGGASGNGREALEALAGAVPALPALGALELAFEGLPPHRPAALLLLRAARPCLASWSLAARYPGPLTADEAHALAAAPRLRELSLLHTARRPADLAAYALLRPACARWAASRIDLLVPGGAMREEAEAALAGWRGRLSVGLLPLPSSPRPRGLDWSVGSPRQERDDRGGQVGGAGAGGPHFEFPLDLDFEFAFP